MNSPSETPRPPFRSPGRQSCLHIVSMGESFVARTQPPLVQEKAFKAILSAMHKTSGVTIGIPNKTAICQPLKAREQRKGTMCHQKPFWKKAQNPPSDSLFLFCLSFHLFQNWLLYYASCRSLSYSFCFWFRYYFCMKLPEIHSELSWGGLGQGGGGEMLV